MRPWRTQAAALAIAATAAAAALESAAHDKVVAVDAATAAGMRALRLAEQTAAEDKETAACGVGMCFGDCCGA